MGELASEQVGGVAKATLLNAVSVVVPVFNEENGVAQTLNELYRVLAQTGDVYEIVVVDDGSRDRTADILTARSDIQLLQHRRNRGYGAALKTGIAHARYPLVAITDADGTYPNERLSELLVLTQEAGMVAGARTGANVKSAGVIKLQMM